MNKKEPFSSYFTDFGYQTVNPMNNSDSYSKEVISKQINPLQRIQDKHVNYHNKVKENKDEIQSKINKYNKLLDVLNEKSDGKDITIKVGTSDSNIKVITYEEMDLTYEYLVIDKVITKNNSPMDIGEDELAVSVEGKTITITKINSNSQVAGWNYDLTINGKKMSAKEKRYFHDAEDFEYDEKRKTHREKLIQDTRQVLLYNNQMFIAGSITAAIALILVYRLSN